MRAPRVVRNYRMHHRQGKPVSREKYDEEFAKAKKKFDADVKEKPLKLLAQELKGARTIYILYQEDIPQTNIIKRIKKWAETTDHFIYNDKKHKLEYRNAPQHVKCSLQDDNWGNMILACQDITSYDWTQGNSNAKHILEVDMKHYLQMQLLANWLLEEIKREQKEHKKIVHKANPEVKKVVTKQQV